MTPITMPAMAPPESPPLVLASDWVSVTFAPVATGVSNGIVVVGVTEAVTIATVFEVARRGALAVLYDEEYTEE